MEFLKIVKIDINLQLFLLILLLAITLRAYHLGAQPLYVDEAWSYYAGDDIKGAIIKTLNYEEHPPLFNILSFFWRHIGFGLNEFTLRILPALAGIIAIIFLYLLAKELFGKKVALISCLIMALSSEHIRMSQEYRPYEMLTCFVLIAAYFLIKALITNKKKYWLTYIIFIVFSGYTDHFSILIMASLFIYAILSYKTYKETIKNFLISEALAAILLIPNIFIGINQLDFLGYMQSSVAQSQFWKLLIIPYNFYVFLLGSNAPYLTNFKINIEYIIPLFLIVIFFSYLFFRGIIYLIKEKNKLFFLLINFVFPIFLLYLASFIIYMQLEPKRFLFITPFFYIIIAAGLSSINSKKIFTALIAILIIISSISAASYFNTDKERLDQVAGYIKNNERDGDVIAISMNMLVLPFRYYYTGNLNFYGLPDEYITQEDYTTFKRNLGNSLITESNFIPLFNNKLSMYKRIWFVQSRENVLDKNNHLKNYFDKNYNLIVQENFSAGYTKLYLYEAK